MIGAGRDGRLWLLALLALAAAAAVALLPPLADLRVFYRLADSRRLFGIANFWNVVSNVPFLLVGAWGLYFVARGKPDTFINRAEKWPYLICFLAVALVGLGSGYYHLAPVEQRLMWDRLPMSLGFMALLCALIAERISVEAGLRALAPLLLLGAASVLYWRWSALRGAENILPYALVQYGGIGAMMLVAALFPSRYTRGADLFVAVAIYGAAKAAEFLDAQIYALGGLLSGHTLKHLMAALAMGWLLRMLRLRRPLGRPA